MFLYLKHGLLYTIPTQWPNCPPLLSKCITPPRKTALASAAARDKRESVREEIYRAVKARLDDERETIAKNNDIVASVNELFLKLELPNGIHKIMDEKSLVTFEFESEDCTTLKFSLQVFFFVV